MSGKWGKPSAGTIRHTHTDKQSSSSSSSSRWKLGKALGSSDWSHMPIDIWVEPISSASCVWPDPSRIVIEYFKQETEREKGDKERKIGPVQPYSIKLCLQKRPVFFYHLRSYVMTQHYKETTWKGISQVVWTKHMKIFLWNIICTIYKIIPVLDFLDFRSMI